jgi:hypothetical protein
MKTMTHVGVDLHQRFCYLTAVDASGKKIKQSQGVNEGAALRTWLLQVAQVAARCSPAARAWIARLKKRKPPQVALIALARKLLTAVWALLRHGVCFDENTFATGAERMQDQGKPMARAS